MSYRRFPYASPMLFIVLVGMTAFLIISQVEAAEYTANNYCTDWFSSPEEAADCDARMDAESKEASSGDTYFYEVLSVWLDGAVWEYRYNVWRPQDEPDHGYNYGIRLYERGDSCILPEIWNAVLQACEGPVIECVEGEILSTGFYDTGTDINNTSWSYGCENGCSANFEGEFPYRVLVGGVNHYFAAGSFYYNGFDCQPGDSDVEPTSPFPADTCGEGQTKGMVNGRTVCVDPTSGEPVDPNPEPEPLVTGEEREIVDNGDGTSTDTTTTTNSDGSTTVVVKQGVAFLCRFLFDSSLHFRRLTRIQINDLLRCPVPCRS